MTTSFWNQTEIIKQFADCTTLKQIINRIESDFSHRGEVICEIRLNGKLLSEEDERKLAENPRESILDLSISSHPPGTLILDALNSTFAYLPELEQLVLRTAEAYRGANFDEAQNLFKESIDGCKWLVDTLMHVRSAASGIGAPLVHPERWFAAEQLISKVIREMTEAYTTADYVLVADLMEYELTGAFSVWQAAIESERSKR